MVINIYSVFKITRKIGLNRTCPVRCAGRTEQRAAFLTLGRTIMRASLGQGTWDWRLRWWKVLIESVLLAWRGGLEVRVEGGLSWPSIDRVIYPSVQVLLPFVFG